MVSRCLPTGSEIEQAFVDAKFVVVKKLLIEQPVAASRDEYLLKIEQRAYSDLAVISDEAFAAGLSRMREAVGAGEKLSLVEPIRLLSFQRT